MKCFQWMSLAMACGLLLGCGGNTDGDGKTPDKNAKKLNDTAHPGHEHGPNGGHLADLGGKYRAEVVVTAGDPRQIGLFLLNHDDSETADVTPTSAELHLEMEGKEEEIEFKAGKIGSGEKAKDGWVATAPASVKSVEDIIGHLHVTIGDETLEGHFHDMDEHDHGKGKHDHEDGKDHKGDDEKDEKDK